jgi:hypothetical protein
MPNVGVTEALAHWQAITDTLVRLTPAALI